MMASICLVAMGSDQQGRLGAHVFDNILPPLGLAYLAAVLVKDGRSVEILDAFAEGLSHDEVFERLRDRPRIVGFYCHTQNFGDVVRMAERLKTCSRPVHVVIGGPHATALPAECLADHDAIDSAVFGEGERTVVELVARVLADEGLAGVRGTCYRDGGEVRTNPPRPLIEDLDSLPMPAWDLLPMDRYRAVIEADGMKAFHVMGSRGCFSDCNYCQSTRIWGPRVRWHSPERLLREIDHLRSVHGAEFVKFYDDNFTQDPRRVEVLVDGLLRRGLFGRWACCTCVSLLDENIIRALARGGVHHVCIGFETVNDRLLKSINKHSTKAASHRIMGLCRKHGVPVLGMFMLGLPTETREEALETLEFAWTSGLYLAVFSFMTVYPGTNFWEMLKDSPRLEGDFSRYSLATTVSYVTEHRSREELQDLMRRAHLRFYLQPRVVGRLLGVLARSPRHIPGASLGFAAALSNLLLRR